MKQKLKLVFGVILTFTHLQAWNVHFSGSGSDIRSALRSVIRGASSQVDVAVYNLSDYYVVQELISAKNRGCTVRVIVDTDSVSGMASDPDRIQMLKDAGISVKNDSGSSYIMHNKFLIADDVVWTGSADFTYKNFFNMANDGLWVENSELASNFRQEFEEMWSGTFAGGTATDSFFVIDNASVDNYFGPEDSPVSKINDEISGAGKSVLFMFYYFTDETLAQTVKNLWDSGITVEGIVENDYASEGVYPQLDNYGIDIRKDANSDLMHLKVIIIDTEKVITGSANLSLAADQGNDENILIINDFCLARKYLQEFRRQFDLTQDSDSPSQRPDSPSVNPVENVSASNKNGEIQVTWSASSEEDFARYYIFVSKNQITDTSALTPELTITDKNTTSATISTCGGETLVDGESYYVAVTCLKNNGVESALGTGSQAGPVKVQMPALSVCINEVAWSGSDASAYDEWIELRNLTSSDIDLTGWYIKNANDSVMITIPQGKTIPADGYFLIANYDENSSNSTLNITPDLVDTGISLSNTALKLSLYDASDNLVDVCGDGGVPFAGQTGSGNHKSMQRCGEPVNGEDPSEWFTSEESINFDAGASECGTPMNSQQSSVTQEIQKGDVVINEIMWDELEYIELYNTKDTAIDISGWMITAGDGGTDDDVEVVIDDGKIIQAHGYYLITDPGAVSGITPDEEDSMTLNQSGEVVQLFAGDPQTATLVDEANQNGEWFAGINNDAGVSMEKNSPELDGTVSTNWHTSTGSGGGRYGTPGGANSQVSSGETPPTPQSFSVYFNAPPNSNNIDVNLINLIDNAQSKVSLACYEISRQNIINALINAKNRGVAVRVVTEYDRYSDKNIKAYYQQLKDAGISIVDDWDGGNGQWLMHDKFCIIDDRYVWTGSYNLTDNGTLNNNNNAVVIEDSSLANAFELEFEQMFTSHDFSTDKIDNNAESFTVNGVSVSAYMGPSDDIRSAIRSAISSAQYNIYFAIYSFTDDYIGDEMLNKWADGNGIAIKGVFDSLQAASDYSWYSYFKNRGIPVQKDTNKGLLHHKFMIIDYGTPEATVITGSANWSKNANLSNDENIVIIKSTSIAEAFYQEFTKLYNTQISNIASDSSQTQATIDGGVKTTATAQDGTKVEVEPDTVPDGSEVKVSNPWSWWDFLRTASYNNAKSDLLREVLIFTYDTLDPEAPISLVGDTDGDGIQDEDFSKPVLLTIPYRDDNLDEFVVINEDSIRESDLRIFRWDSQNEEWIATTGNFTIDPVANTITAEITRSGIYTIQAIQGSSSTGFSVKIYPNPVDFSKTDHTTIEAVAPSVIKIFTLTGREIFKTNLDFSTQYDWYGLTDTNKKVAGGLYILTVESNGSVVVKKIAVLR